MAHAILCLASFNREAELEEIASQIRVKHHFFHIILAERLGSNLTSQMGLEEFAPT